MTEFKNATDIVRALNEYRDMYAWWTPGDMTRYRVALVNALPYDTNDRKLEALLVTSGRETVLVEKPQSASSSWTAQRWLDRHGERYAGWWAGLRPLLAALGWTQAGDRDPVYSPAAANQIGALLK